MVRKIFIFFLFYFLILFQTSFLPPFFEGWLLNLALIFVILINFFERTKNHLGLLAAFFAGSFSDIFSEGLIGFHIFIFFSISIFIKYFLKKHVQLFWKKEKLL